MVTDILVQKGVKWKVKRSQWSKAISKSSCVNSLRFSVLEIILYGSVLLSELSVLPFGSVTLPKKTFLNTN